MGNVNAMNFGLERIVLIKNAKIIVIIMETVLMGNVFAFYLSEGIFAKIIYALMLALAMESAVKLVASVI
jgi:hypothetical protein